MYTESDRLCSCAKMWLARMYVNDIAEFATGDQNRFGRMVDGKGAGCGSLEKWLANLANIAANPVVKHFHNETLNELLKVLTGLGYALPTEAK